MTDLSGVRWPPVPITTGRLLLRRTMSSDRPGCVELWCNPDVRRHLGGPLDRDAVESAMTEVPGDRPGVFAVDLGGELIGLVTLDRRDAERPHHAGGSGDEVELSYLFLPGSWGHGYATEAATAVLAWAEVHLPGEPIVLCTQVANEASVRLASRLGFREVARFVEFDAEQWFGVRDRST